MKEGKGQTAESCHWGNKLAFRWRGLNFFGAGSFRGLSTDGMDVIIDCGANIRQDAGIQIIRIRWQDGDEPALTENNWHALLKFLEKLSSRGGGKSLNVLACCVGGHGRTGTALSILAALTGVAPDDPVIFIRKEYCRKAVETRAQCSYIRRIAKLTFDDPVFHPEPESDTSCESPL